MREWKFALSSADEAPPTAPILLCGDICDNLRKAARLGYNAIEIHTRETASLNYENILMTSKACGAKVAMVVTGRLNTEGRCNLIDDAPYVTEAAINGMKQYIDMAAKLEADIVIGWVKGNIPAGGNREKYMMRLARNLGVLTGYGAQRNVKINLEVINRYEVNLFTTAQETMNFIKKYELDNCYVHLDTFHMNIEERDPLEAISVCGDKLGYFHLADNTRRYPGSGQLNFGKILNALDHIGYEGYLSVECLPYPDAETAAIKAIDYLKGLLET